MFRRGEITMEDRKLKFNKFDKIGFIITFIGLAITIIIAIIAAFKTSILCGIAIVGISLVIIGMIIRYGI